MLPDADSRRRLTTAGHTHLCTLLVAITRRQRRRAQCYVGLYQARCLTFSAPITGRWREFLHLPFDGVHRPPIERVPQVVDRWHEEDFFRPLRQVVDHEFRVGGDGPHSLYDPGLLIIVPDLNLLVLKLKRLGKVYPRPARALIIVEFAARVYEITYNIELPNSVLTFEGESSWMTLYKGDAWSQSSRADYCTQAIPKNVSVERWCGIYGEEKIREEDGNTPRKPTCSVIDSDPPGIRTRISKVREVQEGLPKRTGVPHALRMSLRHSCISLAGTSHDSGAGWTSVGTPHPRSRRERAIQATLTRTPSVSSLLLARRAVFPSLTFDLGADDVDLVAVDRGRPEESNPVAVAHSSPIHLRDLVVAAKPVSDLQNKTKKGGGNWRSPRKTSRRLTASSGTIPTCKNPVTRLGIEPSSPCWETSRLTAQPPQPQVVAVLPRTPPQEPAPVQRQQSSGHFQLAATNNGPARNNANPAISSRHHRAVTATPARLIRARRNTYLLDRCDCGATARARRGLPLRRQFTETFSVKSLFAHYSPPTKVNRVQSCRTTPRVGGFSRGFPVSSALAFRRCSIVASFHRHRLSSLEGTTPAAGYKRAVRIPLRCRGSPEIATHSFRDVDKDDRSWTVRITGAEEIYILLSFLCRFGLQGITAKAGRGLSEMCFFRKLQNQKNPAPKEISDIDSRRATRVHSHRAVDNTERQHHVGTPFANQRLPIGNISQSEVANETQGPVTEPRAANQRMSTPTSAGFPCYSEVMVYERQKRFEGHGGCAVSLLTSHQGVASSIPGRVTPGCSHVGILPVDLGDLPFPPPLYSVAAPFSPQSPSTGSQDLAVKSHPNLFTLHPKRELASGLTKWFGICCNDEPPRLQIQPAGGRTQKHAALASRRTMNPAERRDWPAKLLLLRATGEDALWVRTSLRWEEGVVGRPSFHYRAFRGRRLPPSPPTETLLSCSVARCTGILGPQYENLISLIRQHCSRGREGQDPLRRSGSTGASRPHSTPLPSPARHYDCRPRARSLRSSDHLYCDLEREG
ncbi:hypothetical protein PR048_001176 [Dryococelus australis]|uniref:Uncharacterized protein n=1 Tax=Dryococelus australis TaxID=614101 RepID=A0ABQ9IHA7_9NEOP|nr:hypothetical protein PR048_001176 [Dryococelus australis]